MNKWLALSNKTYPSFDIVSIHLKTSLYMAYFIGSILTIFRNKEKNAYSKFTIN
jgi:hypothetical protein